MKLITFMCITNAITGQYPFIEAIKSHLIFSDKLIIIDGGSTDGSIEEIADFFEKEIREGKLDLEKKIWPQGKGKWTWEEFAHHWNFGVQLAKFESADWICAAECDHIFPEQEALKVREVLETKCKNKALGLVDKMVSSVWYKFKSKSKMAVFINIGKFPNIGYGMDRDGGNNQDLANPIYITKEKGEFGIPEGALVSHDDGKNMGIYMWNYDKTFKTKEQILKDRENCNWAWNHCCLVKLKICERWVDYDVVDDVTKRMIARYHSSPYEYKNIEDHPRIMHDKLKSINENQLGYNLFGEIK